MTAGIIEVDESSLSSILAEYERQVLDDSRLYHSESFEHLESYGQLLSLLASKGSRHREFKHYATRSRVESILRGRALYLSDGTNWNDKYDRERFNPHYSTYKRFGACFSASSDESIAMWMLYGGTDGNGAMINFDKRTLNDAMKAESYECGYFDADGSFVPVVELPSEKVALGLIDVLYFKDGSDDQVVIEQSATKDKRVELSRRAFDTLGQVAKHRSWSYENEVRMVATIDKLDLARRASHITCVKIPLHLDDDFVSSRVFDSPVSDENGRYLDSALRNTVDWDLCRGCNKR